MKIRKILFALAVVLSVGINAEENIKIEITPHINGKTYNTARMIVLEGVPAGFKISPIANLEFTPSLTSRKSIFISISGQISADGKEQIDVSPSLEVNQNEVASIKFEASDGVVIQFDILASKIDITSK